MATRGISPIPDIYNPILQISFPLHAIDSIILHSGNLMGLVFCYMLGVMCECFLQVREKAANQSTYTIWYTTNVIFSVSDDNRVNVVLLFSQPDDIQAGGSRIPTDRAVCKPSQPDPDRNRNRCWDDQGSMTSRYRNLHNFPIPGTR